MIDAFVAILVISISLFLAFGFGWWFGYMTGKEDTRRTEFKRGITDQQRQIARTELFARTLYTSLDKKA